MPVYEYRCLANNHQFDLFQPVGAAPPSCPRCGSASRKVYRSVGLIFKGTGFHVTDYRRPASAGEGASSGAAAGSTRSESGGNDGASRSNSGTTTGSTTKS